MDWADVHLALNHFPIILSVIGALAAILATLSPRRGTWMYAAASLTLAGVLVIPTYFTGEPAEKALKRPWYIARGTINAHEEAAFVSAILVGLVALIGALAWRRMVRYPRETSLPGSLRTLMLVASMAAAAHIYYTSLLGGRIVHHSTVLRGPRPAGVLEPSQRAGEGSERAPAQDSVLAPVAPTPSAPATSPP